MAKMGRPKSDSPKIRSVGLRLTHEQYKDLEEYARKHPTEDGPMTITNVLLKAIDLLLKGN